MYMSHFRKSLTLFSIAAVLAAGTVQAQLAPDDPSIASGLTVWLRDAANNFDGTTWNDVSGNSNHAQAAGLTAIGIEYATPSQSAFNESNGLFAGKNVSGVRFDGQTDDLLRVPDLNGGTQISGGTTIVVYASPPPNNNSQRPIGFGAIQTVADVAERPFVFNPSDDGSIRYDWGSAAGSLPVPRNQLFVRGSTFAPDLFAGEGLVNDFINGAANITDALFIPAADAPGFPVDDTLYLGDVRSGFTDVFGQSHQNDLFVAEVIAYDSALTAQQISSIGDWLVANVAETTFGEFPRVTIDRESGAVTVNNNTGAPLEITGYSISSDAGALDQSNWTTIAGNYDSAGNQLVDANDTWTVLSTATNNLSEQQSGGDGGILPLEQDVDLGAAWIQNPTEDVQFTLTLGDGTDLAVPVAFVGNGNLPWSTGDLDFDGSITVSDWQIFKAGFDGDLTSLSPAQAYGMGDLDGDLVNGVKDFGLFKTLYDAENGAGAFSAMVENVPEPQAISLFAVACLFFMPKLRRKALSRSSLFTVLFVTVAGLSMVANRQADAADISWGDPTDIGGVADVQSFGSVIEAYNAASDDVVDDLVINGVTFVPTGALLANSAGADLYLDTTGDDDYDQLLSNVDFGGGGDFFTITLGDGDGDPALASPGLLQPGSDYQIQVWFVDTRAAQDDREMQFGDGNGNTVLLNDQYVVGSFTADAATQDLSLAAQGFGNAHITAYSIQGQIDLPGVTIDASTGEVTLNNTTQSPFDFDLYRMGGPTGSLNPAGWNSLQSAQPNAGQDLAEFPRGDNNGNGWEELGTPSSDSLSEAFLTGSSMLGASDTISLGNAFNPGGPGKGVVTFEVRTPGGAVFDLDIEYINDTGLICDLDGDLDCDQSDIDLLYASNPTQSEIGNWLSQASSPSNPYKTTSGGTASDVYMVGDANLDGDVNSTDLGLLLNNFNSAAGPGWSGGDLNADNVVNSIDLGLLLNNFNFSSAAAVAVPEPTSAVLAFLALFSFVRLKRGS